MKPLAIGGRGLDRVACTRIIDARDPRFDGVVFVGITTTRIYCRPICPSRRASDRNRRFFRSAAAAEAAGFRPCLRCRPELAPGQALPAAMSRLATAAALRIGSGALNGGRISGLARELGVSERHLRRALQRELGVSPVQLAQTHRLLLAKRLLADTRLSMTSIAYASGFQSLSGFNATFRERYGMPPRAARRGMRSERRRRSCAVSRSKGDFVRLSLAYRPPLAWNALLDFLRRSSLPGVEVVHGGRYGRTVSLAGLVGVVFVESGVQAHLRDQSRLAAHLSLDVAPTLVPVLMPLLARLRALFDLDAEPNLIDECLSQGGLGDQVRRHPGLRVPGVFDGFEVVISALLGRRVASSFSLLRSRGRRTW